MRRRPVAALARLAAVACWAAVPLSLGAGPAEAACGGLTYAERPQAPRADDAYDADDYAEIIEDLSDPGCHTSAPWVGATGLGGAAGLGWAGWALYTYWAGGRPSAMVIPAVPQPLGAGASPPIPPPAPPPAPPAAAEPPPEPGGRPGQGIRPVDVRAAAQDRSRNPRVGDPVDPVTGEMTVVQTDVELPGVFPLLLRRSHLSGYRAGTWFGPGWAATLDQRLELDGQGAVLTLDDGRLLVYPVPRPGRPALPYEGARWPLTWDGDPGGAMRVEVPETGETMEFALATGRVGAGGSTVLPLTSLSDRRGDRIAFEYAADGAPRAVRHSGGYLVRVATDSGRVTSLSLAGGGSEGGDQVLVRFGYDAEGNLTEVVNSSGLPLRWSYDEVGRITGWTDRNGCWYRYEYDDRNRCVRATGPDGTLSAAFDYAPDGRTTVYTDALGHQRRYHYNAARQLTAEIDPLGAVTRRTWDRHDRLRSVTDARGATTRLDHDRAGRLVRVTHPDGRETRAEYDERGLPLTVTEPDGAVWRQSYDERGNRTAVTDPAGATTRFTYDAAGHPAATTDALGRTTRITCDAVGLPVTVTAPGGEVTRYQRDAFGRPTAVTDPTGAVTRFAWTTEGALAAVVRPDGSRETWTYDAEGNATSYTDAAGATTRAEYTHFDLLAARVDATGARHEFTYDAELRLSRVTNPLGLTWRYEYDAAGRLIAETDFDGRVLRYAHDAAGDLAARTNGAGQTIRYERDAAGRLTRQDADGRVTTFAYDAAGRLARADSPDAGLALTRDRLGRITAETCAGRTTTFARDALGRRTTRTTPTGATHTWEYDAAGRRTALHTAGRTLRFTHDAAGRELTRAFGEHVTLTHVWDACGRLTSQSVTAAGRPVHSRSYSYRPDGHPTALADSALGTRAFDLDAAGRVTAVRAEDWSETYAYDAAGNVSHASWPTALPAAEARGERDYQANRLARAGTLRQEHDAQGRVVLRSRTTLSGRRDIWRYTWDAEDHLTSVTTPDGTVWRYLYDPLGRRIAKLRLAGDGSVVERTDFSWDGDTLAEQTTQAPDLPHPVTLTWAHDGHRPLTQTERRTDAATQREIDARFFAIVTDLVGTATHLIDETGAVAFHIRAALWGTTTWSTDATAHTPLRFPGQYHDPESGLHYNVHRYYDPLTATYLSQDPLGLAPSPNPAAYVPNPLTWYDPLGLSPCAAATRAAPDFVVSPSGVAQDVRGTARPDNEFVLSGHGGIRMGDGTPTTVPPGTSVAMYSEHGVPISDALGNRIETANPPPLEVFGPGEQLPDYTLYPPTGLNIEGRPRNLTVSGPTRLSDLLQPNMGRVHWAACRSVV